MKRIYLLMAAALGLATTATAQRQIDVTLQHYYVLGTAAPVAPGNQITDGSHILFDGDKNYKIHLGFVVTNAGLTAADSIMVTDTVHILGAASNIAGTGVSIPVAGNSGMLRGSNQPAAVEPGTNTGQPWDDFVSKPVTLNWCDSVWITSPTGSANPVIETGRTADNIICHSVIVDGWMTGVENVMIGGNGLEVFPNPSNGNMSVVYNFGNNNSGVITIVDMTGKVVYTQQLAANLRGTQTIKVNTQGLATSLYSLRLATGNKVAVEKIYINN